MVLGPTTDYDHCGLKPFLVWSLKAALKGRSFTVASTAGSREIGLGGRERDREPRAGFCVMAFSFSVR
jgi:hypothetical protein